MSQAYKATMDKFVGAAFGSGAPTMFLSGEKQEFPSSEFKVKRRPLARHFVSPDGKEVIQAPTSSLQKKCSQHPKRRLRLFHCRCSRTRAQPGNRVRAMLTIGFVSGYNRTVCVRDTNTGREEVGKWKKCHMIRSLPTLARK